MPADRPDLDAMRRVLFRHAWTDLRQWTEAIGRLAELSDSEIEKMVRGGGEAEPAADAGSSRSGRD